MPGRCCSSTSSWWGCEPLGWDDSLALVGGVHSWGACTRAHACARTAVHARAFPFHPCNPTLFSPSCPIKLKNLRKWNETSKSRLLLWLTWYDLYYNLDRAPHLSRSLFFSLPPTHSRSPSLSFHYLDWLQWKRPQGPCMHSTMAHEAPECK